MRTSLNVISLGIKFLLEKLPRNAAFKIMLEVLGNMSVSSQNNVLFLKKLLLFDSFQKGQFLLENHTFLLFPFLETSIEPFRHGVSILIYL